MHEVLGCGGVWGMGSDHDNTYYSSHLSSVNRSFSCLKGLFASQTECCKTIEVLVMRLSRFQIQLNGRVFYLKALSEYFV